MRSRETKPGRGAGEGKSPLRPNRLLEDGAIGHVADAVKDVTGGERSAELFGILGSPGGL
ncbi:MAG TPA: hypothetical protein VEQ41_07470 [Solirubrobacterales bacterium]|nr:hypothetical protein [Solirubrobacterales bacterium]